MQIADTFHDNTPQPSGGSAPGIGGQIRRRRAYYRRVYLLRSARYWWPRLLLLLLAIVLSVILGPIASYTPLPIVLACLALPIAFQAARRVEFGFLLLAFATTAFGPRMLSLKSLDIYPALPLLLLLFCVLLVQVVFHKRRPVLPSFWAIWPQVGLIAMALASTIIVQATWTHGVPHKINSNPIVYDEVLGVAAFFLPLITFIVTTVVVAGKERLIRSVQKTFLLMAVLGALVVMIDFKRIGADIYAFRFSEPRVAFMSLRALAQLMALGTMLAYARVLYATPYRLRFFSRKILLSCGKVRLIFGAIAVMCLLGVVITLQNSWWVEVGVAVIVMTLVYSRRLFVTLGIASLPLLPVVKDIIVKLQTVKLTDYTRVWIWQDALRVWSKQPALGVGPGNFWAYDQVFTNLPRTLRNFNATGLGVAHNGYLQVLGELGPLGLFFWLSFIVVVCTISFRLYRRSKMKKVRGNPLLDFLGLHRFAGDPERRADRMLALVSIGLICGSALGDITAGGFFLPPRQITILSDVPQVVTSWIIWGFVIYKDQVWRMARRASRLEGEGLPAGGASRQVAVGSDT